MRTSLCQAAFSARSPSYLTSSRAMLLAMAAMSLRPWPNDIFWAGGTEGLLGYEVRALLRCQSSSGEPLTAKTITSPETNPSPANAGEQLRLEARSDASESEE